MSVRENLTLGRPDATDDEIDEALAVAQADFVHDLPWGLDTRVGEQGLSLSGGQRQRLALARAVLGRPRRAGARRPALGARRAHRGARRGGAGPGAARHHRAAGRAPAVARSPWPTGWRCSPDGVIAAVGTHSRAARHRARLPRRAVRRSRRRRAADDEARESAAMSDRTSEQWRGAGAADADAERTAAEAPRRRRPTIRLRAPQPGAAARRCCARTGACWPSRSALLLLQNAAAMAGPYLVMLGIDKGIPPLRATATRACWSRRRRRSCVAAVAEYVGKRGFLTLSGADRPGRPARPAAAGCTTTSSACRSASTSATPPGRMVARLTSDMDSISELVDGGIDDLVLAGLSVVSVAGVLLVARPAAGRRHPAVVPVPAVAVALVRARVRPAPTGAPARRSRW